MARPGFPGLPPEGVKIELGDLVCGTSFELDRPTGIEPGYGYAHILLKDLTRFGVEEVFSGYDKPSGAAASSDPHATTQSVDAKGKTLKSMFAITFSEVVREEIHQVKFEKMLLTEKAISNVLETDQPAKDGLARVQFMDIRGAWDRGVPITQRFNVLKQGAQQKLPDGKTSSSGSSPSPPAPATPPETLLDKLPASVKELDRAGGLAWVDTSAIPDALAGLKALGFEASGIEKTVAPGISSIKLTPIPGFSGTSSAKSGGSPTTSSGADASNDYEPGSLIEGKFLWTLERLLRQIVLPRLPGGILLERLPEDLKNQEVVNLIWEGRPPKKALGDLLDEYHLVLALNPNTTVSLWREGEGPLSLADGSVLDESEDGITQNNPTLAWRKPLLSFHATPASVLVLGPPTIQTAMRRLDPVGELYGKLVPLSSFLKELGLDEAKGKKFFFLPEEQKLSLGITSEGVELFNRCAWRMYQVPGGVEESGDKLPIAARGLVDTVGEFYEAQVWCDTAIVCSTPALLSNRLFSGNTSLRSKLLADTDKEVSEIEQRREDQQAAYIARISEALQKPIDEAKAIKEKTSRLALREDLINAAYDSVDRIVRDLMTSKAEANKQMLAKLTTASQHLVIVNLPFGPQTNGGYRIDARRGLVTFDHPKGHVKTEGIPPEEAEFETLGGHVVMEWGYVVGVRPDQPSSLDNRYWSLWERGANGSAVQLRTIPTDAQGNPAAFPWRIERPDLQLVVAGDGSTNRILLDKLAQAAALEIFRVPTQAKGGVCRFVRPAALLNTGRVKRITWGTLDDGRPYVDAHVESEGLIPVHKDGETYARPRQGDDALRVKSHVVPRSMRK